MTGILMGLFLCGQAAAQDSLTTAYKNAQQQVQAQKKIVIEGKVRAPVFAIGGETTGIIIETASGRYELQLGKDSPFKKNAGGLNGKTVRVEGQLIVRAGLEIKQRRIIQVTSLSVK